MDYFLISRRLEERGLVGAVGVLATGVNGSDHTAVVLDIHLEAALGKSTVWRDIEAEMKKSSESNMNAVFKTIKLGDPKRVRGYQEEVVKRMPPRGTLMRTIEQLHKEATAEGARATMSPARRVALIQEANRAMDKAAETLVVAEKKLHQSLPIAGKKFKHVHTPEFVKLAEQYRFGRRLVSAFNRPAASRPALAHMAAQVRRARAQGKSGGTGGTSRSGRIVRRSRWSSRGQR